MDYIFTTPTNQYILDALLAIAIVLMFIAFKKQK